MRPKPGTTVRHRDGRKQIQDGPYANTKEQLAGFIVLELPSLDAAPRMGLAVSGDARWAPSK